MKQYGAQICQIQQGNKLFILFMFFVFAHIL